MSTTATSTRSDYGPIQLADHVGLHRFQFERARRRGLIPDPDRRGRWSAEVVAALDGPALAKQVGSWPDMGATRAATELSADGLEVSPDAIAELARLGRLAAVGEYHGHPIYDGAELQHLATSLDAATLAHAEHTGALHTADQAADYLRLRRCDLDHLVRAGYLTPASWGRHHWQRSRAAPAVALYRRGALDALAERPELDLPTARATPAGHRSPLASLPTA